MKDPQLKLRDLHDSNTLGESSTYHQYLHLWTRTRVQKDIIKELWSSPESRCKTPGSRYLSILRGWEGESHPSTMNPPSPHSIHETTFFTPTLQQTSRQFNSIQSVNCRQTPIYPVVRSVFDQLFIFSLVPENIKQTTLTLSIDGITLPCRKHTTYRFSVL